MLVDRYAVSWWLLLIWLHPGIATCPSDCTCKSDKGRRRIICTKGGMLDPMPIGEMSADMQVLDISAPNDNWNSLSLGPLFQNFKSLQELHIRRSGLMQIGMHAFWGVPTLKVLNLAFNNISQLFDHNFRGLVNLVELNLECNRIDRLPTGVFRHLSELRVLNLERNRVGELVPKVFMKLSKLEVLKVSWNPLMELDPEVFKDVLELRVLQCRGCGLRRINTQIYHLLPYVTHLDLGNNRMQFIESDEFVDLHRIRTLKLDGNQLPVVLERTFVNNVHLRALCLARNRLAKITNTAFSNLTNLVELDIGYNKLDRLEGESMQPLGEKLQRLVISGNQLSVDVLKVIFAVLQTVTDLSMADMGINSYPAGLIHDRVEKLNLSGNLLRSLGAKMLPQHLKTLDVRGNRLEGADEALIGRLEQLEEVHLANNSWVCDACHISAILNASSDRLLLLEGSQCALPPTLKGRPLESLTFNEVKECGGPESEERAESELGNFVRNKLGLVMAAAGLLLFLIVCILFVVVSCWQRHASRNADIKEKEERKREIRLDSTSAVFISGNNQISFKFPLDLPEEDRLTSVSIIDDIKKDAAAPSMPNGTLSRPL